MSQESGEFLGWYHFTFNLPPEWEVTGYSSNEQQGFFHFATRHGAQGSLAWRKVKARPDRKRIMNEIHSRHLKAEKKASADSFEKLEYATVGDFELGVHERGERAYASVYIPEQMTLVEWTFPAYRKKLYDEAWVPLLESYKPNLGETMNWGAFGLKFALPADYRVAKVAPYPGNVSILFENKKNDKVMVHRWGMPRYLLEGRDLMQFYAHFLSHTRCVIGTPTKKTLFALDGVELEFKKRGTRGFDTVVGKWWKGKGHAIHNLVENRIYAMEWWGQKPNRMLEMSSVFSQKA